MKAGTVNASGATIKGVTANNVDIVDRGGITSVVVKNVQVGAMSAAGAEIGSLNIAGVRLSVRERQIQGSTADIDAGTVKLANGQAENVKLAKPVFVVAPSGSYRATADLSIGGGVMGQMNMGQARAQLVATNREIQFNNFTADVFAGHAAGNARIATVRGGTSQITADFNNVDIAGPLTAIAGSAVPLTGHATGRVDLTFPDTDVRFASGSLTTQLTANTAEAGPDNVPINGTVALRANRGVFDIQEVNLQTPATRLSATGQFSFQNDSNLQLDVASTDAAEFQTVFLSSGLLPEVDEKLREYRIGLGGQLAFNGNIRGPLSSPDVNGRFSLGSLLVSGTEFGALSASIAMNQTDIRVADGQLSERDGGGVSFSLVAPRSGENNASLTATLDRFNARSLLALSPFGNNQQLTADTQADVSGRIEIAGIPNAMSGSANLTLGPGRLAGESLEGGSARATFNGPNVNVESVDVRLGAGHIVANGNLNTTTKAFDFQGRAENVQLPRLAALANRPGLASVTGVADFTAHVVGNLAQEDFSTYQITFDGEARDVAVNGRPAGTFKLTGRTQNQQLTINLTTGILGQEQVVAAQINLASPRLPASIETTLTNADLTNLLAILLPNTGVRVSGRVNGTIKASGNLIDEDDNFSIAGLTGEANLSELSFRVEDIQLTATTPLVVRFRPNEVAFDSARFTGPGTNIVLDGTI
ncbi:MAG TPA: AsmA-like C-terminal region-containing protein, partial [Pyrinomonadaceae bacterium]